MNKKGGTSSLIVSLQRSLSRHSRRRCGIRKIIRHPFERASSFPLEELEIAFEDGTEMCLLLKDLSPGTMLRDASRVKPSFVVHPWREVEAYRILEEENWGTAACYGWQGSADSRTLRLFLERVEGRELYEVGDFFLWEEAARWLARLHRRFSASPPSSDHLLHYDPSFYRLWINRAQDFLHQSGRLSGDLLAEWNRLAAGYEQVVQRLASLPATFIHGEFYASNILVRKEDAGGVRICPVDWEMAALAPGLIDLAALSSGKWSEEERRQLAHAYWTERPGKFSSWEEFLRDLDCCRLHLAVQWLGWSPDWSPPREHYQNWLAEALLVFERVCREMRPN